MKGGPGYLAAALATAMTVMPALTQEKRAAAPDGGQAPATAAAATKDQPVPKWTREPIGGPQSSKFLRVADARGQGEDVAALMALDTSDRNAVILVVQGHNTKVIEDARRELSGLVLDGYDRLGLIIGDGPEDKAYIYSKGFKVVTLSNIVRAENRSFVFSDDVEEVYKRDVVPKLAATAAPVLRH